MGKIFLAFFLLLGSIAALPAQTPVKKVVFLTNYVFLGRHAPFFVGLDKGFYREAGFDLSISPSTGSGYVIAALEGGQADYGIAEPGPVVQAVAKGAQVKAFGVFMDQSPSGLVSLTPYPTAESVAGKSIAASLTDSARVTLVHEDRKEPHQECQKHFRLGSQAEPGHEKRCNRDLRNSVEGGEDLHNDGLEGLYVDHHQGQCHTADERQSKPDERRRSGRAQVGELDRQRQVEPTKNDGGCWEEILRHFRPTDGVLPNQERAGDTANHT